MVVADFNGDGKPDLMVQGVWLTLLLGNGDGTFQPAVNIASDISPRSFAVGDFDGNGTLDLAITTYAGTTNLIVYHGFGDGSFQAYQHYWFSDPNSVSESAGANFYTITAGDFNGDGKTDLVLGNSGYTGTGNPGIAVLINQGDGTFLQKSYYPMAVPLSIVLGDINGDGQLDLVVGNAGGVTVLGGKGDGTFSVNVNYVSLPGDSPSSLAVEDFNADGRSDLAIGGATSVNVMLGVQRTPTSIGLSSSLNPSIQSSHVTGLTFGYGGVPGDVPVVGKW
jgi:hypothetical protein